MAFRLPAAVLAILVAPTLVSMALLSAPGKAGEDRFIFVDRMPAVRGEITRSITADGAKDGQTIVQNIHQEDYRHAVIETYVMTVTCAEARADVPERPYIVAIKYPPKHPKSFAVATLHDVYKEVYVLDRNGRIRLYEDVGGQAMLTLAERFRPACLPI